MKRFKTNKDSKNHTFTPTIFYYTFGPNEPALKISIGDTITTTTVDARGYDEQGVPLSTEKKQHSPFTEYCENNPLVGPFYIKEANMGDILIVHIDRIKLNRNNGWSTIKPRFASLTEEVPGRMLLFNDPLPEHFFSWNIDHERNMAVLELTHKRLKEVHIPLHPFIGSIGVAPPHGRIEPSLTPGEYGGNMDCIETKEGTTLFFPVFVEGAYLSFGDVHAAQGDGELCGSAIETSSEITLRVDIEKGKKIRWPRLIDDEYIMVAGSSRPLMEAYKIAHVELVEWLVSDYGFDKWEAIQMLTQGGRSRIGNIVDPNYTVVAKFPKKFLP